MPQVFKIGRYIVYFWSNESNPREPVHVHISVGVPSENATKVWITKKMGCIVANNNSQIPPHTLSQLVRVIEARSFEIISKWKSLFGEISFYC